LQVKIWEERKGSGAAFSWTMAAQITDFRDAVSASVSPFLLHYFFVCFLARNLFKSSCLTPPFLQVLDCKFAPNHWGLKIATLCSDGHLRIYEAPDVVNLSTWSVQVRSGCGFIRRCLVASR
jgi:hypothetical protein